MSRGVVIIAAGSPFYGEMALNLCFSLKFSDKDIPISLLHAGNGLQHIAPYLHNFDKLIQVPPEAVTRNGITDFLKAKTFIYDLSPYDETIYIDADVLWLKRPISELFTELTLIDFTIGCRGSNKLSEAAHDAFQWAKAEHIIKEFEYDGLAYNLSSEFIYFKKDKKVKAYFEAVKNLYNNPQVIYTRFGGSVPDELAFQLAMIVEDIKPHKVPYLPFYWEPFERKMKQTWEIDQWAYSIGGNVIDPEIQNRYNNLAAYYARHFGLRFPFAARNKKDWIPERAKI